MRVLAASFEDEAAAQQARATLLDRLGLEPHQIGVEALAPSGSGSAPQAVLAGQLPEDVVAAAQGIVEEHGGRVMLEIDATESNA